MVHFYPYSDAHELNLDWILRKMKELDQSMTDFEAMNKITFDGAWDITKQYKAWTIVNDGDAGFISIQPVPKGILLSNADYWRGVVDYTATIADLQNRVVTLENQMITVNSNLGTLNTDVASIKNTISDKNFDIGYMIMLTDSFGENVSPNITDYVPANLNLSAGEYLTHAKGGCGFSPGCPYNYLTELQGIAGSVPDASKVKTILVTGGSNDVGYGDTEADIVSAISAFITYCKTTYPNARVYLAFTGWTLAYVSADFNPTHFRDVYSYWMEVVDYGGYFLRGIKNVMHRLSNFNGDNIHPNGTAQVLLGRAIANALLTGDPAVSLATAGTMTVNTGYTLDGNWKCVDYVDDDIVTARFTGTGSSPSPRVNITSLTVNANTAEPQTLWFALLDDCCIGNNGASYAQAYQTVLFTSTELTQFIPMQLVRQFNNVGMQLCLPAGTYTNATVYLPANTDIVISADLS